MIGRRGFLTRLFGMTSTGMLLPSFGKIVHATPQDVKKLERTTVSMPHMRPKELQWWNTDEFDSEGRPLVLVSMRFQSVITAQSVDALRRSLLETPC